MAEKIYSITLEKLMKELQFEEIYMPVSAKEILITNREVNRPGLALAGFLTVFEPSSVVKSSFFLVKVLYSFIILLL